MDPLAMQIAVAVAFIAAGANMLGAGLLLLFNPGSRSVRWYGLFAATIVTWLLLQGWSLARGQFPGEPRFLYGLVVHMMPMLFLAASLVQMRNAPTWQPVTAIAVGLIVFLLLDDPLSSPVAAAWQAVAWAAPASLYLRRGARRPTGRGRTRLDVFFGILIPVAVVSGIVVSGGIVLYFLPLMTFGIQFLIFAGVVHHRYYDIEVRAARSGALATEAAELERLAVLGEMSATIAHEVRNPLTGIRSLAQRLRDEQIDDARRMRYTDVILDETTRLERIVSNLLDVARREWPRPPEDAVTELEPLLDDLRLLIESRASRAGIVLRTNGAGVRVHAGREPLAQALLNLLLNALRHSPERGVVHVSASLDGDIAVIRVRDQGPGIPAAERERVFEPFRTSGGGTGLGLAVVRRLAQENGWRVEADDAPGGGAELRLIVPCAHSSEPAAR